MVNRMSGGYGAIRKSEDIYICIGKDRLYRSPFGRKHILTYTLAGIPLRYTTCLISLRHAIESFPRASEFTWTWVFLIRSNILNYIPMFKTGKIKYVLCLKLKTSLDRLKTSSTSGKFYNNKNKKCSFSFVIKANKLYHLNT